MESIPSYSVPMPMLPMPCMMRSCALCRKGDSSGGMVEVVVTGVPAGMGEPVFNKLDGELGRLMSIGTVKAVEIGCGVEAAQMTGSQCNDAMRVKGWQGCVYLQQGRWYYRRTYYRAGYCCPCGCKTYPHHCQTSVIQLIR